MTAEGVSDAGRMLSWGVRASDGTVYRVGLWKDGEWHPGSLLRAVREWWLLRERGSRVVRVAR